jgi:hypothetical protein
VDGILRDYQFTSGREDIDTLSAWDKAVRLLKQIRIKKS